MTDLAKLPPLLLKGKYSCLHLTFNVEHAINYDTVEGFIRCGQYDPESWVSPEEMQKSIDTNSVWTLQWYPDTPIGFYTLRASSIEALLKAIEEGDY